MSTGREIEIERMTISVHKIRGRDRFRSSLTRRTNWDLLQWADYGMMNGITNWLYSVQDEILGNSNELKQVCYQMGKQHASYATETFKVSISDFRKPQFARVFTAFSQQPSYCWHLSYSPEFPPPFQKCWRKKAVSRFGIRMETVEHLGERAGIRAISVASLKDLPF